MSARSIKKTVAHVQQRINECWEAQALLIEEDPEYVALDEQIKAYQDVHVFLTEEEFDGEFDSDDGTAIAEPDPEPEEVLVKNEDTDDDEEETDED